MNEVRILTLHTVAATGALDDAPMRTYLHDREVLRSEHHGTFPCVTSQKFPPTRSVKPLPVHVVADGDAGADGGEPEQDPARRGTPASDPVDVVAGGQAPGGVEREPRDVGPGAGCVVHDHRVVVADAGVVAQDVDPDAVGEAG